MVHWDGGSARLGRENAVGTEYPEESDDGFATQGCVWCDRAPVGVWEYEF